MLFALILEWVDAIYHKVYIQICFFLFECWVDAINCSPLPRITHTVHLPIKKTISYMPLQELCNLWTSIESGKSWDDWKVSQNLNKHLIRSFDVLECLALRTLSQVLILFIIIKNATLLTVVNHLML